MPRTTRLIALLLALTTLSGALAACSQKSATAGLPTQLPTGDATTTTVPLPVDAPPCVQDPNGVGHPAPQGSRPGDLIASSELVGRYAQTEGFPTHARAWRISYVSTGVDEHDLQIVCGMVAAPADGPKEFAGSGRMLAWSHGTSGLQQACLPSLLPEKSLWGKMADGINNVAWGSGTGARNGEAATRLERALQILTTLHGPDSPRLGNALNSLGSAYLRSGRYAEAEALLVRATTMAEAAGGPSHPDVVTPLNNLALSHERQGRYADATVFSFHAVKIVTTAEGGLVTTQDAALANQLQLLRSHGMTREAAHMHHAPDGPWYYEQVALGFNYRQTDVQAALGLSQLGRLQAMHERRIELADRYDTLLADLPLRLPARLADRVSAWHLYAVEVDAARTPVRRLDVFNALRAAQIGVNVHYIPIHTQPYYRALGFQPGDFPAAEQYYAQAVSLPLFPALTAAQQDHVAATLRRALAA